MFIEWYNFVGDIEVFENIRNEEIEIVVFEIGNNYYIRFVVVRLESVVVFLKIKFKV